MNKHNMIEHYSKNYLGKYSYDFPTYKGKKTKDNITFYSNNIYGFRSQEFGKLSNKNYNILYAGCSHTYGSGLPLNLTWFEMLSKEISDIKENLEYFNIAYIASSIHGIIRNILSFIENYGNPDIIFMHLPPASRNLTYSYKYENFTNAIFNDYFAKSNVESQQFYNLSYKKEDNLMLATTLLFLLEKICKESGIKIIWSAWDKTDNDFYKELNFTFFMPMDNRYDDILPNHNNLEFWEIAADNEHPGSMWSTQFSKQNLEEYIRRGYDK